MTTDEKIVAIVKNALKTDNGSILIRLGELFERRGRFANLLKEIMSEDGTVERK